MTVSEPGQIDLPSAALLGRDAELAQLYRIVESLTDQGGAFVVRGEAGIGKSALLTAAAERARALGAVVLTAEGVESEAQFPFAGLHQLLLPSMALSDRLPAPHRHALEMAFGIAPHGGSPDVFLVSLAALGLISELATET